MAPNAPRQTVEPPSPGSHHFRYLAARVPVSVPPGNIRRNPHELSPRPTRRRWPNSGLRKRARLKRKEIAAYTSLSEAPSARMCSPRETRSTRPRPRNTGGCSWVKVRIGTYTARLIGRPGEFRMRSGSTLGIVGAVIVSIIVLFAFLVGPLAAAPKGGPGPASSNTPVIRLFEVDTFLSCFVVAGAPTPIEGVVSVFWSIHVNTTDPAGLTLVRLFLTQDVHSASGTHFGATGFLVHLARPGMKDHFASGQYSFPDHDPVSTFHPHYVWFGLEATDAGGTVTEAFPIDLPDCNDN